MDFNIPPELVKYIKRAKFKNNLLTSSMDLEFYPQDKKPTKKTNKAKEKQNG